MRRIGELLFTVALLAMSVVPLAIRAETWPSRPITIIVPYPAGGVTDNVVRLLADRMKDTLGQPVIVENVSGASGTIGAARVARADPDGYMILLGNSEAFVATPATMALPYDPSTDFAPIILLPSYPFLMVTPTSVPATTLPELIAWIKDNPDKVLQGTVGTGTAQHLCGLLLAKPHWG